MSKSLSPKKKGNNSEGRKGWVPALVWTAAPLVLLVAHRVQLDALAELLLKKEVVFREDLEKVLGPK
jgi:hypothetical protein